MLLSIPHPSRCLSFCCQGTRKKNQSIRGWQRGNNCLVVEPSPSEKYEFVNWDDEIPIYGKKKNCPNHQSVISIRPKIAFFWWSVGMFGVLHLVRLCHGFTPLTLYLYQWCFNHRWVEPIRWDASNPPVEKNHRQKTQTPVTVTGIESDKHTGYVALTVIFTIISRHKVYIHCISSHHSLNSWCDTAHLKMIHSFIIPWIFHHFDHMMFTLGSHHTFDGHVQSIGPAGS